MQLCEIVEAAFRVGKLAYLFFKLLQWQVLPCFQFVAHYLAHLVGVIGITKVVGSLTVQVIQNLITQRARGFLTFSHDAQRLASHQVPVAVHPRQQTAIAQADPLVFRAVLIAERVDDILYVARRILDQEGDVGIYLINHSQNSHTLCQLTVWRKVAAQTRNVRSCVCLYIEEDVVVGISQRYRILLHITKDRDSHTMNIVTLIATQISIRIGRLHHIDRSP